MNKIFAVFLAAILLFACAPVQADELSTLVQGNLGYVYGHTGYNGGGYYSATGYARHRLAMGPGGYGYNRGHYGRSRRDHTYNNRGYRREGSWETIGKVAVGFGAGVLVGRHLGSEPRVEYQLPPRQEEQLPERQIAPPPVVQPPAPPLSPDQTEVLNASGCEVVLYLNGSYLLALKPGEKVVAPTLVGLTAAGSFNGKMAYAVINPFSAGAVITAPGR